LFSLIRPTTPHHHIDHLQFRFDVAPERRGAETRTRSVSVDLYATSLHIGVFTPLPVPGDEVPHATRRFECRAAFLAHLYAITGARVKASQLSGSIFLGPPTLSYANVSFVVTPDLDVSVHQMRDDPVEWRAFVERLLCRLAAVYCDTLGLDVDDSRGPNDALATRLARPRAIAQVWRRALRPDLPVHLAPRNVAKLPPTAKVAALLGLASAEELTLAKPWAA
jgi:hypothetical protein